MSFNDNDQLIFERAMNIIERSDSIADSDPWNFRTNARFLTAQSALKKLRIQYPAILREVDETIFCINNDC